MLALLPAATARAQDFVLEKLSPQINSDYDEISPVVSRDGKTLFFTRVGYPEFERTLMVDSSDWHKKRPAAEYYQLLAGAYTQIGGAEVYDPVRSRFNQDVWVASGDSAGQFPRIAHPGFPLNNALPNSIVATLPDPRAFYVINQFPPAGGMERGFSLIRQTEDSLGWSAPRPIEIADYYTITSDVSLTMSFDGKILILSAARFDSRDMDLYVCFREGEHRWSAPRHLGNLVNSARRETTPFLSEDNVTLFFASNRGESSGGSDIFMCKRLDDGWQNWTTPTRLVEPINSSADDGQPYFNMTTGYLYFASRRAGSSDIYRLQIAPPQPTEIEVIGRVLNRKTGRLAPNTTIRYGTPGESENSIRADNGTFRLKIPKGLLFLFSPEKPAFIGQTDSLLLRRDHYYFHEHYLDLYVEPLEVNSKIRLQAIFFQQSKAIILEESYPELQRLANILSEMPSMKIRIEGHTDNIGKAEDLLRLSEERAQAIRTFLQEKGIAPQRIEVLGHGPKFPINDNSNDELRKLNRRVEIIITQL